MHDSETVGGIPPRRQWLLLTFSVRTRRARQDQELDAVVVVVVVDVVKSL
jgi:hypothetical protein